MGVWIIGGILVAGSIIFFGPSLGCPPLLLPAGSSYVCNEPPWVGPVELFLVLGFLVTYLVVVPILTFSNMINWASLNRVHHVSQLNAVWRRGVIAKYSDVWNENHPVNS
jgi:hypothetical protein